MALGSARRGGPPLHAGHSAGDALALADLEVPIELFWWPSPLGGVPHERLARHGAVECPKALIQARNARQAIEIVRARPDWSPFAEIALDAEAVLAYEKSVPLPGPAVRLLDHSALLIFKDGKSLRWVHEVLAIREAAEYYGELGLPENSGCSRSTPERLTARFCTPRTPPRRTPLRCLISTRVMWWRCISSPVTTATSTTTASPTPCTFRGWIAHLPAALQVFPPPEASSTCSASASTMITSAKGEPARLGKIKELRFRTLNTLRLPRKATRSCGPWLPSIRVGWNVRLSEDLDYLQDRLLARRRRTLASTAGSRRPSKGKKTTLMPRFRALVRKVGLTSPRARA